ncbi:hypothetical protein IQ244_00960 [Nostoc sp. LEGE 06077]|uniref:hypothetical protein n=1 Tax=Nostoc sp. LEGE 06077 TaxID=915325 RepID=UPI001880F89A|nr:hypothetical protein [Nostoc sp. LEGE 06077]MBE9205127.1 hypothetical protein [Nostoc sp. LEGE 06077]
MPPQENTGICNSVRPNRLYSISGLWIFGIKSQSGDRYIFIFSSPDTGNIHRAIK